MSIISTYILGPRWMQKSVDLRSRYLYPHLEPRAEVIAQYRPPMSFCYIIINGHDFKQNMQTDECMNFGKWLVVCSSPIYLLNPVVQLDMQRIGGINSINTLRPR